MTIKKRLKVLLIAVLLVVSIIFSGQATLSAISFAHADTTVYSDVLDDLEKDETFNLQDYPVIAGSYDIELIQIAESTSGELLLYVYQPGNGTLKEYVKCNYINIATDNAGLDYNRYSLKFIDSTNTISKYKVNDFTVSKDTYRYYTISAIYRPWLQGIDTPLEVGSNTIGVDYVVGWTWRVYYLNNEVTYERKQKQVVDITDYYVSYVRYHDGFKFFEAGACDSHFVAFNCDFKIDNLIDATVIYDTQDMRRLEYEYSEDVYGTIGDAVLNQKIDLSNKENVSYTPSGWFANGTFSWKRIENSVDFVENEKDNDIDLGEHDFESFKSKFPWVLRFLETDYRVTYSSMLNCRTHEYTKVSKVSILRLHFISDGKVYNLGAVSPIAESDGTPFGESDKYDFEEFFDKIISILILIVLLLLTPAIDLIITIVKFIFSGVKILLKIILSPFKLVFRKQKK